jgi:hypothetical protein
MTTEGVPATSGIQLERDVLDELFWDDSIDVSLVKASVDDGTVVLSGWVRHVLERMTTIGYLPALDGEPPPRRRLAFRP